jgi:hypothetical protein
MLLKNTFQPLGVESLRAQDMGHFGTKNLVMSFVA